MSGLTWHGLLAIAYGSHERYGNLDRDNARSLVTSIRARDEALAATLDRVRAAYESWVGVGGRVVGHRVLEMVGDILAGAPNAALRLDGKWGPGQASYTAGAPDAGQPCDGRIDCGDSHAPSCRHWTPPEPKGPEQGSDECDHCHAPIDGDKAATSDVCWDCWQRSQRDLAAAKARIAELEAENEQAGKDWVSAKNWHEIEKERADREKARADAAEARLIEQVASGDAWREGMAKAENRCHALSVERDQLAAQVERIGAIVSEMLRPSGIPGPSQRLVLRVRAELGIGRPQ